MSQSNGSISTAERIHRLERRADVTRSRLLRAVDALDARRHRAVAAGQQAARIAKPVSASLVGIVAVFGAGAWAVGRLMRSRRRPSLAARAGAMVRDLTVARPSLTRRIFDSVAISIATYAATALVKQATTTPLRLAQANSPPAR